MATLVNKNNPQIRITAPEIKVNIDTQTFYIGDEMFDMENWTLVVEEPEKIEEDMILTLHHNMLDNKVNCPFDKGDCRYCTMQFCGAREENHIETRSTAGMVDCSSEEHPDNFTSFEWLIGRLMFRGCDLWGMTDGEDDNGVVTKLIKDKAVEMMELLERKLDILAEPEVDLEKILELVEKTLKLFTERNLDRRRGYTNHDMQDAFILGFKAGIEKGGGK